MKIGKIILQLGGIDLASLKEEEILEHIKAHCIEQGFDPDALDETTVYINVEGTAVTAYFTCENCSGAVRLN